MFRTREFQSNQVLRPQFPRTANRGCNVINGSKGTLFTSSDIAIYAVSEVCPDILAGMFIEPLFNLCITEPTQNSMDEAKLKRALLNGEVNADFDFSRINFCLQLVGFYAIFV